MLDTVLIIFTLSVVGFVIVIFEKILTKRSLKKKIVADELKEEENKKWFYELLCKFNNQSRILLLEEGKIKNSAKVEMEKLRSALDYKKGTHSEHYIKSFTLYKYEEREKVEQCFNNIESGSICLSNCLSFPDCEDKSAVSINTKICSVYFYSYFIAILYKENKRVVICSYDKLIIGSDWLNYKFRCQKVDPFMTSTQTGPLFSSSDGTADRRYKDNPIVPIIHCFQLVITVDRINFRIFNVYYDNLKCIHNALIQLQSANTKTRI